MTDRDFFFTKDEIYQLLQEAREFIGLKDIATNLQLSNANLYDLINAANAIISQLNQDPVTMTYVTSGLYSKVNKTGDTLTGYLTLHSDPVYDLHATSKRYTDNGLNAKLDKANVDVPLGVPILNALGQIKSAQLPSYVDDVLEFDGVNNFPAIGERSKIYVDTNTSFIYRWSGTVYIRIITGPVLSVNNKTGVISLGKGDIGLGNVDNTSDMLKSVLEATRLTTMRNINGTLFNGTQDIVTTYWGQTRSLTFGHFNTSFNGSADLSVSLNDMGAVNKAGDTLTGFLTLNADPTDPLHAVTKQYADQIFTPFTTTLSSLNTTVAQLNTDPVTKTYVDTQDALKINKAGDTLTGYLTLHADPVLTKHPATKSYVDVNVATLQSEFASLVDTKVNRSGDTLNGYLILHANPTNAMHPTTKAYVDNLIANLQSLINTITITLSQLSSDPVTKAYVDTQDAKKVNKAGDTLTGYLTLHADPTAALHPASKNYTDIKDTAIINAQTVVNTSLQNQITQLQSEYTFLSSDPVTKTYVNTQDALKVSKTGDTMSGYLFLNADPTMNLHAAPKQYVDNGLATKISLSLMGKPNGVATLDNSGKIPPAQLPGYLDDVVEYPALADFPVTGTTGILYVALDTNYIYRWSGSAYIQISSGANTVQTVNGHSGPNVTLVPSDIGLGSVDNTADSTKSVLEASQLTTSRLINGTLFNGTQNITTQTWGTQRSIKIGQQSVNVDGSTDYIFTLSAIGAVNKTGDTLTGYLTLNADPTELLHAATKQYVDQVGLTLTTNLNNIEQNLQSQITSLNTTVSQLTSDPVTKTYTDAQLAAKVNKAGDILTGYLTLNADPIDLLHAASKHYVDATKTDILATVNNDVILINTQLSSITTILNQLNTDPITKSYVDTQDALKVSKAGDTMSGPLVLSGDPTTNLQATTKQYTDALVLNHANNQDIHLTPVQNTLLDNIAVSASEVNTVAGASSNLQNQINTKLGLAGGTLTGSLILNADPTQPLEAATKEYVDSIVVQNDGVPIGTVILSSCPDAPNGYLRCNGSYVDKITYASLYAKIQDRYTNVLIQGHGKPWVYQEEFNPNNAGNLTNWAYGQSLPRTMSNSQSFIAKGRIYILGGNDNGTYLNDIYYATLDVNNDIAQWNVAGVTLPVALAGFELVKIRDYIYIIGGFLSDTRSNTTIYRASIDVDGNLSSFTIYNTLPIGVGYSQALIIKNKLYLFGGYTVSYTSSIYVCNIDNVGNIDSFVYYGNLPNSIAHHRMVVHKNRVFLLGGAQPTARNYVYSAPINPDNSIGAFINTTALPKNMYDFSIYAVRDMFFLIGGTNGKSYYNSVYTGYYDETNNSITWTAATTTDNSLLPTTLSSSTQCAINDKFYILSSYNTNTVLSTTIVNGYSDYDSIDSYILDSSSFALPDKTKEEAQYKVNFYIKY